MTFLIIQAIIAIIIIIVAILISVAFITIAERKTMGFMQRRLGPNTVGYFGILQPFADALKLILKEYVSPSQSNLILFFLGPIITLIFSLLGYLVIPLAPGISLFDFDLGILYLLAVSSLSTYGILLAGWSANSKYAFLGSLRSTAQLISYELIISSIILLIIILTGSLNLTIHTESQIPVWFIFPLIPAFIIFLISAIAETNRAPFDLAEAESELVSGFMTEHSAIIFVYFFLAEYSSILLICILTTILFLGGYLYTMDIISNFKNILANIYWNNKIMENDFFIVINNILYYIYITYDLIGPLFEVNHQPVIKEPSTLLYYNSYKGYIYSMSLSIKTSLLVFIFIWVRASYPRIRFDQLMSNCWTILLPIVIAIIIVIPSILFSLYIIPMNIF